MSNVRTGRNRAMKELVDRLRAARSVLVLTGSGISAESGLPTFRGTGGLWRTHRVEELASPEGFARDPLLVWTWYNERNAVHRKAQPNAGHYALSRIGRADCRLYVGHAERRFVASACGLAERGGASRQPSHGPLHSVRRAPFRSMHRVAVSGNRARLRRPDAPRHRLVRGGAAPGTVVAGGRRRSRAEVILVVGTSAVVYPAAALATHYSLNAYVAEINPEATALSERARCTIRATAATALPAVARSSLRPSRSYGGS